MRENMCQQKSLLFRNRFKSYDVCMGFCEPARQDYSPPPPGNGGTSSNGANGDGYAPPPPPSQISGAEGNADGNGRGDEGVDPEVEKHEYDPEACKV